MKIKINGVLINGLAIAYEGCHKIYICETEDDIENAKKIGYKIYPLDQLKLIYENSCDLRFINNWKLDKTYAYQDEIPIIEEIIDENACLQNKNNIIKNENKKIKLYKS